MTFLKPYRYQAIKYKKQSFIASEIIQKDVESNLNTLLQKESNDIQNIIVVGAWHGDEVRSFLGYTNALIYCFEPGRENFAYLQKLYSHQKRVFCFPYACGSQNGKAVFYDTTVEGNGSLLSIKNINHLKLENEYTVEVRRLDSFKELQGKNIDLLWADTQGHELEVLKGAGGILGNCRSLFLEIADNPNLYNGGAKYSELKDYLLSHDFDLVAEGKESNGDGNAFFLKFAEKNMEIRFEGFPDRIFSQLDREYFRRKVNQVFIWRILPESIRIFLKKQFVKASSLFKY